MSGEWGFDGKSSRRNNRHRRRKGKNMRTNRNDRTERTEEGELEIQCAEVSSTRFSPRPRGAYRLANECTSQIIQRSTYPLHILNHIPRQPLHPDHETYREEGLRLHRISNVVTQKQNSIEADEYKQDGTEYAIVLVALIFVVSFSALFYLYVNFPELAEDEKPHIKLPTDIEDAKRLGLVLDKYKDRYYIEVLAAVFFTYLFLQTFAIPGSISLSILSGFLFPFPAALLLVCFCSATGASLCYLLSNFVGRPIIYRYMPERVARWSALVNKHRANILNYILFLRITPFLPNWFINIVSPVINVPLLPFWWGTFIGVAPPSFVAIQAGQTLYKLTSSSDAWSSTSIILLGIFAVLSLLPVILKHKLKAKFE